MFAAPRAPGRPHRRPRTPAEVSRFFTGLELPEPGIVPVQDWRPEQGSRLTAAEAIGYGAAARAA
ncbi:MAG: SAM-dependent methyltransferase [Actinomycetota bacterium]|nr:SAM-dependent methyltransferase [Actinomycetota bacterium]